MLARLLMLSGAFVSLITVAAAAQEPAPLSKLAPPAPEPITDPGVPVLLNGPKPNLSGYGGLSVVGSSMKGRGVVYVGAEGALLVNHRFALGLGGYGLASRVTGPDDVNGDAQQLQFGYGGLVLRYSFIDRRPYYLTVGTLVGAGGVGYGDDDNHHHYDNNHHSDGLFVLEPSIGAHLNLTRWARVGAQVSYRFVSGIDQIANIKEKDLSGFAYGCNLQLGVF